MKLRNYEKLRNLKMKVSKQIFKCTHCEADKKLQIYCHHQFIKKSNCEQKKLKEVLLWLEETEKMILKIKCVNFLRETAYFPTSLSNKWYRYGGGGGECFVRGEEW